VDVRLAKGRDDVTPAEVDLLAARGELRFHRGDAAAVDADVDQSGNAVDARTAQNRVHISSSSV